MHGFQCHRAVSLYIQIKLSPLLPSGSTGGAKCPSDWFNPQSVWNSLLLYRKWFGNGGKTDKSQQILHCTVMGRGSYLHLSWHWYYNHTLHGTLFEMFLREAWSINILWALKINCLQWSKTTALHWFPLKFEAVLLKAPDFKHCWFSDIS